MTTFVPSNISLLSADSYTVGHILKSMCKEAAEVNVDVEWNRISPFTVLGRGNIAGAPPVPQA
jgi:hypothetical protein